MFVHKALDVAPVSAAQRAALFQMAGITASAPEEPGHMITDAVFFDLFEKMVAIDGACRSVPVRMGAAMRCDDYGAFGLAFKSAPNLLGSYKRVQRYGKVVTSIANFRVVGQGDATLLQVIPGEKPRLGLTMTNELAIAAAVSLSREVSGGAFAAQAVQFMHDAPGDNREQLAHFNCPIQYGAAQDAIAVANTVVHSPNLLGDRGISSFFDAHLDTVLDRLDDPTALARQVRDQIGAALSEGVPTLGQVAEQLGMSSRTLQRRLAGAGLAYQDLVADARQALAENLLRQTDYALAEIAFLTGFSDQSTFTRAFKRRRGETPASFRRVQ